jgi:DNA topoisomerase I
MPRLKQVKCSGPGFRRRRRGRGFEYLDEEGRRIEESEIVERIRELAIPPAWKEVWICPHPSGHLQAVGTDDAGRRQYLYHEAWRHRRDLEKFEHMLEFAGALPELRRITGEMLASEGLGRERVLACAVRLLDRGFFRIGTEGYAEQNQTYGLATMEKRHVRVDGNLVTFDYAAKGGKRRIQSLLDEDAAEVVASLKRRRGGGKELLAYKSAGRYVNVRSNDINDFIKEVSGREFTAKDFRTWSATVLAAVALAVSAEALRTKTGAPRAVARAVKEVAEYLGNTPAVSRSSYIDPRVIDRFHSGWTIRPSLDALGLGMEFGDPAMQGAVEEAVLDLIDDHRRSDAVDRATKAS